MHTFANVWCKFRLISTNYSWRSEKNFKIYHYILVFRLDKFCTLIIENFIINIKKWAKIIYLSNNASVASFDFIANVTSEIIWSTIYFLLLEKKYICIPIYVLFRIKWINSMVYINLINDMLGIILKYIGVHGMNVLMWNLTFCFR